MNLYNITKWQLIVSWVFGISIMLLASDSFYTGSSFLIDSIIVITPYLLIFYTLGWKNKQRK